MTSDITVPPTNVPDRAAAPLTDPGLAASATSLAASAAATDRYRLVGVMTVGGESRALIVVDGQPARVLRLGEAVDGSTVVQRLTADGAILGPRGGSAVVTLQVEAGSAPPATVAAQAGKSSVAGVSQSAIKGIAVQVQPIRDHGSKYRPIPQQPVSTSQVNVGSTTPSVDDGRWRPSGSQ
jgi:hypothetical protein